MMKPSIAWLLTTSALLASCASSGQSPTQTAANAVQRQSVTTTTTYTYPTKKPAQVTLYQNDKSPHAAYRVIGVANVAKTNLFGVARKEVAMNDMLKSLAASIGGDGVIDIHQNKEGMQANVIAYQQILI